MALRESSTKSGQAADLQIVTGALDGDGPDGRDGNVPSGGLLAALAEAVARWHWPEVAELREESVQRLGPEQTCDAILVAAGFNGITRVADAIGIRLDQQTAAASVALRAEIGIDAFAPVQKWASGGA